MYISGWSTMLEEAWPRGQTRRPRRQTQRAILIPKLLPFYSNFLAFKPSKRIYLGNIIAEERRAASFSRKPGGWVDGWVHGWMDG